MTKQEAIQAMREGNKVTHRFFESDEFVFIQKVGNATGDVYTTEDGCEISDVDFWILRPSPAWDNGWELYNDSNN